MENENFDIENVSEEDNSNPFAEGVKSDAADVSEEQTADDEKSSDDFSADETPITGTCRIDYIWLGSTSK